MTTRLTGTTLSTMAMRPETDTDRYVRLESFDALIMVDQILVANGHGTQQERQAAHDARARQEDKEEVVVVVVEEGGVTPRRGANL